MSTPQPAAPLDPLAVLKGLASLRRLTGTYPPGHPMIGQKLKELGDLVAAHLHETDLLRIDVIRGDVFLDSVASSTEGQANQQLLGQLTALGVDSIHIRRGVELEEFLAVAEFLWQFSGSGDGVAPQLAARNVRHISLGKLVPLDTRWRAQQWPDAPTTPLDPDYAESILRAQQTFEDTAAGKPIDIVTVRDLVQVLIHKVARSNAALGQILAVKQYREPHLLPLGERVGAEPAAGQAGRAGRGDAGRAGRSRAAARRRQDADSAGDRQEGRARSTSIERKTIESHTTLGAEILVQTPGLHPLTPTVALEHHRGVKGTGYPDLGNAIPHPMSQIVSVADIYEAITGARTYQDPTPPERACLILARLAGEKLNTALVKTFVNAITFFPLGSLVRTNRNELGLVVATNHGEPLHPVIRCSISSHTSRPTRLNTATRDASGAYERHINQSVPVPEGLDVRGMLEAA